MINAFNVSAELAAKKIPDQRHYCLKSTEVQTEPQTEPQTEALTEPDTKETAEAVTETQTENQTNEEHDLVVDIAIPYYLEFDDFFENWGREEAKKNADAGLNQTKATYSMLVPVIERPDWKFRLVFEADGLFYFYYMPAHIDNPISLEAQRNDILIAIRKDALRYMDEVNAILQYPNAVYDTHPNNLVRVEFTNKKLQEPEDNPEFVFDLAEYFTFEIITYSPTAETDAVQ